MNYTLHQAIIARLANIAIFGLTNIPYSHERAPRKHQAKMEDSNVLLPFAFAEEGDSVNNKWQGALLDCTVRFASTTMALWFPEKIAVKNKFTRPAVLTSTFLRLPKELNLPHDTINIAHDLIFIPKDGVATSHFNGPVYEAKWR